MKTNDVTILCKVVDNFGDIGVVYRLARALTDLYPDISIRIIVDNLKSFSLLEPLVQENKEFQKIRNWQVFLWDAEEVCTKIFMENPPEVILECFQCGRPDWLEKLLFEVKFQNIVQIIMIDYLTAEDYAETFHKLNSLTRSAKVQKVNFMPGFSNKTGGLILDKPFVESLKQKKLEREVIFFSYPKNWVPAVKAFQKFNEKYMNGELKVLLAKGAGFESFESAYDQVKKRESLAAANESSEKTSFFELEKMPFLSQIEWDGLLCRLPLLFIRGEDSLSRACLCGVPFVWHAYPQSEEYQLVKVQALLDRMGRHFDSVLFQKVERCWQVYNKTDSSDDELEAVLFEFLESYEDLKDGFKSFSASLLENGDLAQHLVQFIQERLQRENPLESELLQKSGAMGGV